MSIPIAIRHVTRYRYDRPVVVGPQTVRLHPAPRLATRVSNYSIAIEPANHMVNWSEDPFGNYQARYFFPEETRLFQITVDLTVDLTQRNPFDFFLPAEVDHWPFAYGERGTVDLSPYLMTEPAGPAMQRLLASIGRSRRRTIDLLVHLNTRLAAMITYRMRLEAGVQTPERTLELAEGSCRDTAWLFVQLLRHLGFAARFVSGYLVQLKAVAGMAPDANGPAEDTTDLHAWAEVYLPGAGWIGLDATSGLLAAESHIPLAAAAHYSSTAPVTGTVGMATVEFEVETTTARRFAGQMQNADGSQSQFQSAPIS